MIRIIHVMRSPVGGLFRHVIDLSQEQIVRGYQVGVICDTETGGDRAAEYFDAHKANYALGIHRISMPRLPGMSDFGSVAECTRIIGAAHTDIIHGHGAKGGAYARLAARKLADDGGPRSCFYTPHGGTLHYHPRSVQGKAFFTFERFAQTMTSALLFESDYGRSVYTRKIGQPSCPSLVVHNGVRPEEFLAVPKVPEPVEILFIGEMRKLKGVSVLLQALKILKGKGLPIRAILVGNGPDEDQFKAEAQSYDLGGQAIFLPAMPARQAFAQAQIVVIPSLNESLPYIVLEAGAAEIPIIATAVGGIPEIFGGEAHRLVAPDDPERLAKVISATIGHPGIAEQGARSLRERLMRSFTINAMTDGVHQAYARHARLTASQRDALGDDFSSQAMQATAS